MDKEKESFFGEKFDSSFSGQFTHGFDSFFTKTEEKPSFGLDFSRDFSFTETTKPENVFKKPQKLPNKPVDLFASKRPQLANGPSEIKKPKLEIPMSPAPKPNLFQSNPLKKPIQSTPRPPAKVPHAFKPSPTNFDISLQPLDLTDEISHIEELHQSILALEKMDLEETYAEIHDLIQLKKELPSIKCEQLQVRLEQVQLLNEILSAGIPEVTEKVRELCGFT